MKFINTIKNIFSIEELKNRILTTLLFIAVFRFGAHVVLPGVDPDLVGGELKNGLLGLLDLFVGGAFSQRSIFGLGIMPYISASIIIQLATFAIPSFQKMQKEGESGRKKINQYTRFLTIAVCLLQSIGFIELILNNDTSLLSQGVNPFYFRIQSMILLTAGTMFCLWMGEKITEKGIGNGVSLLIMIGIIARLPQALIAEWGARNGMDGILVLLIEAVVLFLITMGTVALVQAVRRVPISYAKNIVDNKVYGGQRDYIPLKVNIAGVMPIIFAQAVMVVPGFIVNPLTKDSDAASWFATHFLNPLSWGYNALFALLIILFTYFYTAIIVNPQEMADGLKKNGGFIPGVKPGKDTANYIDMILSKITFPGALAIAFIAILPAFARMFGVNNAMATFYGGTSLLIMVGVVLDTLQQIESYLLMKHYEGMMKTGKVRGRTQNVPVA